jgi:ATP-dependent helicase/nuclease subunit B
MPHGVSFVDALALQLIAEHEGEPATLARAVVLLPTRRAVRALTDAFLRRTGGRPLLLPRWARLMPTS